MKKSVKAIIAIVVICVCVCTAVLIAKHSDNNDPSETTVTEGSSPTEEKSNGASGKESTDAGNSNASGEESSVTGENVSGTQNSTQKNTAYKYTNSGFDFSALKPYSGAFVEDGSDEEVKNIASITIGNSSGEDCRYAEVTVETDKGTFEFTFTTLKNGESITVLEKNRKSFKKGCKVSKISIESITPFNEEPSVYSEMFELTVFDGVINIKNISDNDIDGLIYVYYKNKDDSGLFGGITYRISFDSLKAGELKQSSSKHLSTQNSVMEFITYVH